MTCPSPLPRNAKNYAHLRRSTLLLLSAGLSVASLAWAGPERPAALRSLEERGVTIVGTFPAPGGLTAWAGFIGQRPLAFYATPDGKHVIAGTLLDAAGNEVAKGALDKAVAQQMTPGVWKQLESSKWIEDGKKGAPRTVYVFTDPNCPFCHKFWSDARPWVDGGKVVLRHVMVGVLTPTSPGVAAALLVDKDPSAALSAHERGHGVQPMPRIPPAVQAQLEENEQLMASLGIQGTPGIVWRDASGALQVRAGADPSALPLILGPR